MGSSNRPGLGQERGAMGSQSCQDGRPGRNRVATQVARPARLPTPARVGAPGQNLTGRLRWRIAVGGGPGQGSSQAVRLPRNTKADHLAEIAARERAQRLSRDRSQQVACPADPLLEGPPGRCPAKRGPNRHPPRWRQVPGSRTHRVVPRSCSLACRARRPPPSMAAAGWMDGDCWRSPPPSRSPHRRPVFPRAAAIRLPLADPAGMWSASTARTPGRACAAARPGASRAVAGLLTVEGSGLLAGSRGLLDQLSKAAPCSKSASFEASSTPAGAKAPTHRRRCKRPLGREAPAQRPVGARTSGSGCRIKPMAWFSTQHVRSWSDGCRWRSPASRTQLPAPARCGREEALEYFNRAHPIPQTKATPWPFRRGVIAEEPLPRSGAVRLGEQVS